VPPQLFALPFCEPSGGQMGVQQPPPVRTTSPLGQPQVPPHPFDWPPRLPSAGQLGAQQVP